MIDKVFFQKYQKILLFILNTKIGRWFFQIHNKNYSNVKEKKIIAVLPNAIRWNNKDGSVTTEYRTNNRFAYRVNTLLKYFPFLRWEHHPEPIRRWVPQLQLGLTVSPFYPNPNPESTSVDGRVTHSTTNASWATIIAGAGTSANDVETNASSVFIVSGTTNNGWNTLQRAIFLFDTSSITDSDIISSATLSLFGNERVDNLAITPNINIYSSAPASNTALVAGDFDSLGTTEFSTSKTYAAWSISTYNVFTLNASGLTNITKTGVSKFGARNANYDVAASAPTWSATNSSYLKNYLADQTGTANDPKLEITHEAVASFTKTHTTDSNKRKVTTKTHTTDAAIRSTSNPNLPFGNPFLDTIKLPVPSSESMTPVWSTAEIQTLAGKDTRKLHSRKYSYTLVWTFMKPQDYTAMENKINEMDVMTFTYGRYSQTESGVQVTGELSDRVPVTRYPKQTYLSKVTLKLLEVNPR